MTTIITSIERIPAEVLAALGVESSNNELEWDIIEDKAIVRKWR